MMKKRKTRSRNWIITTLLASVALGYAFFVFLPGQTSISQLHGKLREQQTFIVQSDRLMLAIKQAEDELARTRDFDYRWRQTAPDDDSSQFARISELARDSGIAIGRIERQPVVRMGILRQIPFSIAASGKYEQVFDFIAKVEALDQTVWIDELTIQPVENRELVKCELTMRSFADIPDNSD